MNTVFTHIVTAGGRSDLVAQAVAIENLRLFLAGSVDLETQPVQANILRTQMWIKNNLDSAMMERYVQKLDSYSNNDAEVDVIYHSTPMYNWQAREYVAHDVMLATAAIAFVAGYLLLHTYSAFLTIVGLLNIVLSFPLAYFVFRDCLGNTQELPVLSVASLFVTIGIAVDDVFVFIDTFKQAPQPGLDGKLLFTVAHAGKATLFTTITSAAAFASSTLSPIPALHDFGLFTALVVMANYILVVTWGMAGISLWWKRVRPLWEELFPTGCCSKKGNADITVPGDEQDGMPMVEIAARNGATGPYAPLDPAPRTLAEEAAMCAHNDEEPTTPDHDKGQMRMNSRDGALVQSERSSDPLAYAGRTDDIGGGGEHARANISSHDADHLAWDDSLYDGGLERRARRPGSRIVEVKPPRTLPSTPTKPQPGASPRTLPRTGPRTLPATPQRTTGPKTLPATPQRTPQNPQLKPPQRRPRQTDDIGGGGDRARVNNRGPNDLGEDNGLNPLATAETSFPSDVAASESAMSLLNEKWSSAPMGPLKIVVVSTNGPAEKIGGISGPDAVAPLDVVAELAPNTTQMLPPAPPPPLQKPTLLHRALRDYISPAVHRRKVGILVVTAVLFVVGLWLATTIRIGLQPPSFAPEGSNIARAQLLRAKFPGASDGAIPVPVPGSPTPVGFTRAPSPPPPPSPPPQLAPTTSPTMTRGGSGGSSSSNVTAAPRTVDEYPNLVVDIVFGIRKDFVDRIGESRRSTSDSTSLWRPVFDAELGSVIYTANATDWHNFCVAITNSSLVVPGQYDRCVAAAATLATRELPSGQPLPTTCVGQIQWFYTSFVSSSPIDGSPFSAYDAWLEWDHHINGMMNRFSFVSSAFPITSQWTSTVVLTWA